jgi:hypothetical protein
MTGREHRNQSEPRLLPRNTAMKRASAQTKARMLDDLPALGEAKFTKQCFNRSSFRRVAFSSGDKLAHQWLHSL